METLRQHRTLLLCEGILFLVLGLIAIIVPVVFTFGFELFIGWLLLIGGAMQGWRAIKTRHSPGFWASLAAAILAIIVGVLLIARPMEGVITLTILLTLFFLIEGISKIFMAFSMREYANWGWLLFSGLLALAMAAIIYFGWPGTAMWVLGLLVGINMLFFGYSLIILYSELGKP